MKSWTPQHFDQIKPQPQFLEIPLFFIRHIDHFLFHEIQNLFWNLEVSYWNFSSKLIMASKSTAKGFQGTHFTNKTVYQNNTISLGLLSSFNRWLCITFRGHGRFLYNKGKFRGAPRQVKACLFANSLQGSKRQMMLPNSNSLISEGQHVQQSNESCNLGKTCLFRRGTGN